MRSLGTALCLLGLSGCWQPSATEGLVCAVDEDCAGALVCDPVTSLCVSAGELSAGNADEGPSSGEEEGGPEPCSANFDGDWRCAPGDQLRIQNCSGGVWNDFVCDAVCSGQNEGGMCKQAGVCNFGTGVGDAFCTCVESYGTACDASNGSQQSCTGTGLYQFCDIGTPQSPGTEYFVRRDCGCRCAARSEALPEELAYNAGASGPCTDNPDFPGLDTNGAPDCMCADDIVSTTCPGSEEGLVDCVEFPTNDPMVFEYYVHTCTGGVRCELDCAKECQRRALVEGAAWDGETALCNNAVQPVSCICGF